MVAEEKEIILQENPRGTCRCVGYSESSDESSGYNQTHFILSSLLQSIADLLSLNFGTSVSAITKQHKHF